MPPEGIDAVGFEASLCTEQEKKIKSGRRFPFFSFTSYIKNHERCILLPVSSKLDACQPDQRERTKSSIQI